jgi:hypothetical protein
MGHRRLTFFVRFILVVCIGPIAARAIAFVPDQRWGATASAPPGEMGDPVTLTWSIVPEGTLIQGEGSSNLVQFLDGLFGAGSTGGDDLTHRPWFPLLAESFDRWSQLSGMTFVYEPADDGLVHGTADGALGVRGDVRIGGASVDGPLGTLAYIYFPSNSDLVVDTSDGAFFANPALNRRQFRNTLMHELGHGFGLAHVASSSDAFLMEPAINISFDGPQLDDIRGIQSFYGDALEKSHNGAGNDTFTTATHLGALSSGGTRSIGADAALDTVVDPVDSDFVSIANSLDSDFFSFDVNWPVGLNAVLLPHGGVFNHGQQGGEQSQVDANSDNDLRMTVFGSDGVTALASADRAVAGDVESLSGVFLPAAGRYFIQVAGSLDAVQLYQLDLTLVSAASLLQGDFNRDGEVDAADYVVWRKSLAEHGVGLAADANYDQVVDVADYDIWRRNFGSIAASGTHEVTSPAPEAATITLALLAVLIMIGRTARPRSGRL